MEKRMTPETRILFKVIEDKLGIPYEMMVSKKRTQEIVFARRVFCVIARKDWGMTFKKVGDLINRDHSSVLYYVKKHDNEYKFYEDYSKMYKTVFDTIQALFLAKTELNPDFLKLKVEQLLEERQSIDDTIKAYRNRIKQHEG